MSDHTETGRFNADTPVAVIADSLESQWRNRAPDAAYVALTGDGLSTLIAVARDLKGRGLHVYTGRATEGMIAIVDKTTLDHMNKKALGAVEGAE